MVKDDKTKRKHKYNNYTDGKCTGEKKNYFSADYKQNY